MTLAGLIIIVCLMILPLMVFFIHPVRKTIIAGSTKELHKQNKLTTKLKKEKIILKEGYEYIPVLGNCMSKNDIHEGDYVNVKMFDKTMSLEDKAKEIKEGDTRYKLKNTLKMKNKTLTERKILANTSHDINILNKLSQDEFVSVRCNVASNIYTPKETLSKLSFDESTYVQTSVYYNHNTPYEIRCDLTENCILSLDDKNRVIPLRGNKLKYRK